MKEEYKYKENIDVCGVQFLLAMTKPVVDIETGYFALENNETKSFNKYITSSYVELSIKPHFDANYNGILKLKATSNEFFIDGSNMEIEEEFDQDGEEFELQFEMISEDQRVQKISFKIEMFIEEDEEPVFTRFFTITINGFIIEGNE